MKKISILLVVLCALLVGCSSKKGLDGSLSEIMKEVYAGIPSDDLPDLENNKVTSENFSYYLGDVTFKYKEALASEPTMSSIAHSVVLVRLEDAKDADTTLRARRVAQQLADRGVRIFYSIDEATDYLNELYDIVSGRKKG